MALQDITPQVEVSNNTIRITIGMNSISFPMEEFISMIQDDRDVFSNIMPQIRIGLLEDDVDLSDSQAVINNIEGKTFKG